LTAARQRIVLVRHVETEWSERGILQGRQNPPLDEAGKRKLPSVSSAVYAVSGRSDDLRIVSSPLARAAETARYMGESLRTEPPCYSEYLQELSFGDWEGRPVADLDDWPEYKQAYERLDPFFCWPGAGETLSFRAESASTYLQRMLEVEESRNLIVVSHGLVIQGVLAIWIHDDISRAIDFDIPPGSVSVVERQASGAGLGLVESVAPEGGGPHSH
jgi:probable phosphoglycerate mutase